MFVKLRRFALKKLIGNNGFLRKILRNEYTSGHQIKATLMMLYLIPLRNKVKLPDNGLKKYDFIFSKDYYNELHDLLHISKVQDFELVRLGKENDGGYILLNDFESNGIAYSFGISGDVSWDKGIAQKGYDVFMYDHTIEGLPEENSRFHFFKNGIADGEDNDERLKTLEYFIKQNHHENERNMIFKMDVEGAEWGFIEAVSSEMLSQFDQLLFEFHWVNEHAYSERVIKALRKLNKTHKPVHVHGQNAGYYICFGGKTFCNQIEVTYARRDKYNFVDDYDVNLPLNIDMPANPYISEAVLGHWNEKMNPDDKFASIITVHS